MKVTMVSNYINHHQIPFCREMSVRTEGKFTFIQTEEMEADRVAMGWSVKGEDLSFVKYFDKEPELCKQLVMDSDIVIFGGAPSSIIRPRLEAGKIVLRYSERIYRKGQWRAISPRGLREKYNDHIKYRKAPMYMLCAGGYAASDFHLIGAYPKKMLKWGYFTQCRNRDIEQVMGQKRGQMSILWVGRLLPLKHPERMVVLARQLKREGYDFHIKIIGDGEMREMLEQKIVQEQVEDYVTLLGYRSPQEIRQIMDWSHIFVQTSDYKEGWGAVINEAMDSGCAVVASHATGAASYLVDHRNTGLIYECNDQEDLHAQVRYLLVNPREADRIGRNGWKSIQTLWSPENAAERILELSAGLLAAQERGEPIAHWLKEENLPEEGPCSRVELIPPRRMYDRLVKRSVYVLCPIRK